jgi:hypothetical protein
MNCPQIKTQFPDFLTGDLDEDKKIQIQAHLAGCPSCREELESLSAIWTKLGVLPEERPSPTLRTRFYTMLENHQNETAEATRKTGIVKRLQARLKPFPIARPALQFSLSLILLLIGLAAGSIITNRTGRPAEFAQLQNEVRTMRQTLAISLLEKSSAFERLQGVNLSYDMKEPDSGLLEALLETVNTDQNINVRLAAVDALYLFYDNPIVTEGVAGMLSNQTSPLVQVALIDLVVNMHERRAVESLKNLIQSETLDPDVKQHAQLGLQKIVM